jgi:Zn-dependent protease
MLLVCHLVGIAGMEEVGGRVHLDPVYLVLWFIVFLFSLSFHEAAHAWTSEKFGDSTGRDQGRITLNPIPHIDLFGTIIFPLFGMFGGFMFGWAKPVQTNPLAWRDKTKANIMVSAAGPASNAILATVAFVILKIMLMSGAVRWLGYDHQLVGPYQPGLLVPISMLLTIMLSLNIILCLFNFIPVPPLDGSHILESLLPYEMARAYEQIRPFGMILLVALILLGVFGFIYYPVFGLVKSALQGSSAAPMPVLG